MNDAPPMLSVRSLRVVLGGRPVLDGVDLAVRPREIVAVVGRSGCGKSTLLRACIGALAPAGGEVEIEGRPVKSGDDEAMQALRRRFGALFQGGALITSLTVGENVALPLRQHTQLDESTIRIVVRLKLGLVGLGEAERLRPSELSGGMRKRAALARALALDPPLVFCDEPSAGLDPVAVGAIDRLLLDLRRALGLTAVVVTHEMPSAFRIADRIVMMHGGRLIAEGTPAGFRASEDPRVKQFLAGEAVGPLEPAAPALDVFRE